MPLTTPVDKLLRLESTPATPVDRLLIPLLAPATPVDKLLIWPSVLVDMLNS